MVGSSWRNRTRCYHPGTLEHDGKMWCKIHHPPTVEAKAEKRKKQRDDKWNDHREAQKAIRRENDMAVKALAHLRREQPELVKKWEAEYDAQ